MKKSRTVPTNTRARSRWIAAQAIRTGAVPTVGDNAEPAIHAVARREEERAAQADVSRRHDADIARASGTNNPSRTGAPR